MVSSRQAFSFIFQSRHLVFKYFYFQIVSLLIMGMCALFKPALAVFFKIFASLWMAIDTAIILALLVVGTYHINVLFRAVVLQFTISIHEMNTNILFHDFFFCILCFIFFLSFVFYDFCRCFILVVLLLYLPNSRSNQNQNPIEPKIWRGSIFG